MILPMVTFAEAKQEVASLVARCENLPTRTLNRYDEENTKKDFVLPLFHHLGWEIDNLTEVAAEEKASSGRVDYAFKLGGVSKFYVEVKPLREDLSNRTDWAKQAITYAENKGVTWAILTNFKQLMLFNAEWDEPNLDRARFLNLTCHDYEADFAKLWWLSKKSTEEGVLNEEARKVGALKPKLPVEKSLYSQLLKWRTDLFNQIFHYQKDKGVNLRQTDELIQQFINRLIFIRNVEDRGIEENKLRAALHQWRSGGREGDLIDRIRDIFRNFASVYDSDLFPLLDAWDSVFVESVTLERIIDGLYERPTRLAGYDFAAIDADVLGAVYEQYLGYVAQVAQEQAKREAAQARLLGFEEPVFELEAKRLKRKQQGIYYTPKFVVDYIVRETVGRFLKERNHNEIVNIKILDPACGSGSFLIRAYDELLNHHAYQRGKVSAELDQWERLPILTGNIFGVDLDRQAVEIARLNLLLRSLSKQETLPSLSENIRQGNSLISGAEEELRSYFGDAWQDKKPFNWQTEFKDIMAKGGFDVVISNPPYVGFHGFAEEKPYLKSVFQSAQGRFDLYLPFIEKGIQILKQGGLLGFICPTNFMKRQHGQGLRRFLQQNCKILKIVDFEHYPVFEEALNYTGIFIFEKLSPPANHYIEYIPRQVDEKPIFLKQSNLDGQGWAIREEKAQKVIDKIKEQANPPLSKLVESISEGIVTGLNQIYLLTQERANKLGLEAQLLKPAIRGKEIQRYFLPLPHNTVIYPYRNIKGDSVVIPEEELKNHYPVAWEYLNSKRKFLSGRDYFNKSAKTWYEIWCERAFRQQEVDKIVVRELSPSNQFAYCDRNTFYMDTVCGIIPKDKNLGRLLYLLGLLNSTLLEFVYKQTTVPKAGGFYIYKTMFLKNLPIRHIDFNNPADKKRHDDLVALVDRMLGLNKRFAPIRNTACAEQEELLRQIKQTDQEIDNLVYDLYGLTEEEKKIVEEATGSQK